MFFIGVFTQVLSYFRAEKTPRVNTATKIKTKSENLVQKVCRENLKWNQTRSLLDFYD